MFKISPIPTREEQMRIASLCKREYREGAFAYAMCDSSSGELMGFSQFEITERGGIIYDMAAAPETDDFEAMFILARSTMNFIDMCGAHKVYSSPAPEDERVIRAAGLKQTENGEYFADMTGLFDGKHCSGDAVKI